MLWIILAFIFLSGGTAFGIILPNMMRIGTVTPVNPAFIFIPKAYQDTNNFTLEYLQYRSLQVPAMIRAAGSIETTDVTDQVSVTQRSWQLSDEDKNESYLAYDGEENHEVQWYYEVTDAAMGLLGGNGVTLKVNGSCTTRYSWFQGSGGYDSVPQIYNVFGSEEHISYDSRKPPMLLLFVPVPDSDSNMTFALVPDESPPVLVSTGTEQGNPQRHGIHRHN